jgi:hypothetical protein
MKLAQLQGLYRQPLFDLISRSRETKNPEVDVDLALLRELGLNIEGNDRAASCESARQITTLEF